MKHIKRYILVLGICFFAHHQLFAQTFMQSFGPTISVLFGTIKDNNSTSDFAISQYVLTYFPRFNFVESENSSLSIGAPVDAGINFVSSTVGDDAGISFAYDLPLVLDYNIGCKSTMDDYGHNFGGYFGIGFGYYKVKVMGSAYSDFTGVSYGPLLRGGVRFRTTDESWGSHAMTIGFYYKKGMEASKLNTIGINVLYDL